VAAVRLAGPAVGTAALAGSLGPALVGAACPRQVAHLRGASMLRLVIASRWLSHRVGYRIALVIASRWSSHRVGYRIALVIASRWSSHRVGYRIALVIASRRSSHRVGYRIALVIASRWLSHRVGYRIALVIAPRWLSHRVGYRIASVIAPRRSSRPPQCHGSPSCWIGHRVRLGTNGSGLARRPSRCSPRPASGLVLVATSKLAPQPKERPELRVNAACRKAWARFGWRPLTLTRGGISD
jgi:hypothetical protein